MTSSPYHCVPGTPNFAGQLQVSPAFGIVPTRRNNHQGHFSIPVTPRRNEQQYNFGIATDPYSHVHRAAITPLVTVRNEGDSTQEGYSRQGRINGVPGINNTNDQTVPLTPEELHRQGLLSFMPESDDEEYPDVSLSTKKTAHSKISPGCKRQEIQKARLLRINSSPTNDSHAKGQQVSFVSENQNKDMLEKGLFVDGFVLRVDQSTEEADDSLVGETTTISTTDVMLGDRGIPSLALAFRNSHASYPAGVRATVVYTTSIHHRIKMQVKRRIFRQSQILFSTLKVYKCATRQSTQNVFLREARVSLYLIKDSTAVPLDTRVVDIHTSEWLQFDATEAVSLFVHQPHLFKGLEIRVNSIHPGVQAARAAKLVDLVTDEKHIRRRHRPFFVVYFSNQDSTTH